MAPLRILLLVVGISLLLEACIGKMGRQDEPNSCPRDDPWQTSHGQELTPMASFPSLPLSSSHQSRLSKKTVITGVTSCLSFPSLVLIGKANTKRLYYNCSQPRTIALTYDDGPSAYTDSILDILKDYGITAAFFVIGSNISSPAARATVRRIYDEGHVLGSHSWSHSDFTTLSNEQIQQEMSKTAHAIHDAAGVFPRYMRPPYSSINERVEQVLNSLGYKIILWNLDTEDWLHYRTKPSKIYDAFLAGIPAVAEDDAGAMNEEQLLVSPSATNKSSRRSWISIQHDLHEPNLLQQKDIIDLIIRRGVKILSLPDCINDTSFPHTL